MLRHRRPPCSTALDESISASAQVWQRRHSPWVLLAHGCVLLLAALPASALAQDDTPLVQRGAERLPAQRDGFTFDLRLAPGAASANFTESDRAIADFEAFALGASARFGWFVGPHVLLGAELSSSWHAGVGSLRVRDAEYFRGRQPGEAHYTVVAPLGGFVELYPWRDAGWFLALGGGVGIIDLPGFSDGNKMVLTSGYSLDLGYELSPSFKQGPAAFLRYSRWAGEQFIVSEHPDGLVSRELLLGLRWSFWTPEWQ